MPDAPKVPMSKHQEAEYGAGRDYSFGAPHLLHAHLRERIAADLGALVRTQVNRTGSCHALELGAGHGTFTESLVQSGARVTVTEMSGPSANLLERKFADAAVKVVHDPLGHGAAKIAQDGCDLVVIVSVLHHIPDYLDTVKGLTDGLKPGGAFYCVQDPTWYPSRSRFALGVDRGSYLIWRLAQGNFRRGLRTRSRRLRRVYDETEPSDMVEYHVVRQGVDQRALVELLEARFKSVELWVYWSTQSKLLQRVGDTLGWKSTFGITATGRRQTSSSVE